MEDVAPVADAVARHAVVLLVAASLAALVLARLAWHVIERYAPRWLALAAPVWHRVDRRRLAARRLGLAGGVGLVVAVLGALAFVELVDALDPDEALARFDEALAGALQRHLSEGTLAFFARLTHLGDRDVLTGLVAVAVIALAIRREWLLALAVAVCTAGAGAVNSLLKLYFSRARPEFVHDLVTTHGYSFPSGHAAGSFAVYGIATYLAVRHLPRRWHLPVAGAAMLLIVFVGASRVLLQVHFFSDVIGGWLGAATWTALCITGLESLRTVRAART